MITLRLTVLIALLVLPAPGAHAATRSMPQAKGGNPPQLLVPAPTATGHEIGLGLHINRNPYAFYPRLRYRYTIKQTAVQGPLSGFWLEVGVAPGIPLHRYLYGAGRSVFGNVALNLGYEFAPFSNLALTFAPVLHNEFNFGPFFAFMQTYGAHVRLYLGGHWVVFLEPFSFGWAVAKYPTSRTFVRFSHQYGMGFGYKF